MKSEVTMNAKNPMKNTMNDQKSVILTGAVKLCIYLTSAQNRLKLELKPLSTSGNHVLTR